MLGVPSHAVTVEIRRMGGGFGGKETQGNQFAALAAIAAKKLNRAVKIRPDRDDDMIATGKRHDFLIDYEVGFDDDGNILGVDYHLRRALRLFVRPVRPGHRPRAVPLRQRLFLAGGACALGAALHQHRLQHGLSRLRRAAGHGRRRARHRRGRLCGRQGPARDPQAEFLRRRPSRNVTPYHQTVEDNIIQRIVAELEESADYARRRREIAAFNANSRIIKRGLALTPVKFGISFTATHYNQAGALVHVYTDGSVHLNHGGTEMGQGLYVKVAQVVAEEFQIDIDQVKITATTTGKVPNTSATAASSGSDLNGMAAQNAARRSSDRLIDFAAEKYQVPLDQIVFLPNRVRIGNQEIAFADLVKQAYMARIQLSAAGFYKTPKIHWNRDKGEGHPFYYFAYGASCSEVSIDTLTGEYMVERTDILHETGRSLNRGDRPRPGRGRLHPGHGLADDRGTVVGRQGPAAHPCAVDLQDPAGLRPAEDLQRDAGRLAGEPRADRSTAPRRSASRPSCSACRCCMRCRMRWRASPTTRSARASTRRRRRSAC